MAAVLTKGIWVTQPFRRFLHGLLQAVVVLCLLGTLLGLFGRWHWFLDLFAHFRLQSCVCLFASTLVFVTLRHWRWAGLTGAVTLCLLGSLAEYYWPSGNDKQMGPEAIKVLTFNVLTENRHRESVANYLREQQADVVFLMEVNERRVRHLERNLGDDLYPYRVAQAREDNFGLLLMSRWPLRDAILLENFSDSRLPSVQARVDSPGGTWTFVGTHPLPPMSRANALDRDQQLRGLADHLQRNGGRDPLVLAGDLNATPFSHPFRELVRSTGLIDSSIGRCQNLITKE